MQDAATNENRPTPMRSAADLDFDRRRRNDPPRAVGDRADYLFARFPRQTWFQMLAELGPRWMRIGEVGYTAPNAATQHFGDNSCSIIVNSGLFDFVDAVCVTLFSGSTVHDNGGVTQAPLAPQDVARELAALYEQWKSGALWRGDAVQPPAITLPDNAAANARHLADTAMLFIISHEIGHAILHGDVRPEDRNATQENQADARGFELSVLGYGLARDDARMSVVGATIALRILSALHVLGHVFPGHHPAPERRLAKLRASLQSMSDSEAAFYDNTTVAYAFEEMMDMGENAIRGRGVTTSVTADRLVSRLWSGLIEYRRRTVPFEMLQSNFAADVQSAPPSVLRRSASICGRLLSVSALGRAGQPAHVDEQLKVSIEAFDRMVAALPPETSRIFQPPVQN